MDQAAFVFTIFFMLLGPIKVIPAFAAATRGKDVASKRKTAVYAALFASAICAFIALAGQALIEKYHLSLSSLQIAGGMVLLIAALRTMFMGPPAADESATDRSPIKIALTPLASPAIVPPAGVAVLLIASMLAAQEPGLRVTCLMAIAIMMVLDFLAMFFNDTLVRQPALLLVLQLLGSVLVFVQVALGIDTILDGVRRAGLFPG